jgi:predicted nuclease of predicted toxin-antitoxin system
LKILFDVSLAPAWVAVFTAQSWQAAHWGDVGNPSAPDSEILEWAGDNGWVVFTHDLDFGTLLALKQLHQPSVVRLRGQEVTPSALADFVVLAFRQLQEELERGVLVTIDPHQDTSPPSSLPVKHNHIGSSRMRVSDIDQGVQLAFESAPGYGQNGVPWSSGEKT